MEEEKSHTSQPSAGSIPEAFQDLKPIPEERQFNIDVVECIQEESNPKTESDDVNDEDLKDLLDDEEIKEEEQKDQQMEVQEHEQIDDQKDDGSMSNEILMDDSSIIDNILTKRSPKKCGKPKVTGNYSKKTTSHAQNT